MFAELQRMEDADNEFTRYQMKAQETAVFPTEHSLRYLTLGLLGEAGEIANKLKKVLRGDYEGKGAEEYNKAADQVIDECGDVLWYTSQLLLVWNIKYGDILKCSSFDEYADRNKLRSYDVNDHAIQLGAAVGLLCTLIGSFDRKGIKFICVEVAKSVTLAICQITAALDRPFESVFEGNLEKLKKRAQTNAIKGDSRE